MYGAVFGDIIGSCYEWHNVKSEDFELFPREARFTDDSVPPAIEAFFETEDYESCIRRAISLGGDSDTIAAIAGGIAEAYYREIPNHIVSRGKLILDSGLKRVLNQFEERFNK